MSVALDLYRKASHLVVNYTKRNQMNYWLGLILWSNELFDLNTSTATVCPSPIDDYRFDRTSNEVRSSVTYQSSIIVEGDVSFNRLTPSELDATQTQWANPQRGFLLVSGRCNDNRPSISITRSMIKRRAAFGWVLHPKSLDYYSHDW